MFWKMTLSLSQKANLNMQGLPSSIRPCLPFRLMLFVCLLLALFFFFKTRVLPCFFFSYCFCCYFKLSRTKELLGTVLSDAQYHLFYVSSHIHVGMFESHQRWEYPRHLKITGFTSLILPCCNMACSSALTALNSGAFCDNAVNWTWARACAPIKAEQARTLKYSRKLSLSKERSKGTAML